MPDLNYTVAQCTICKNEYTSTHFRAVSWLKVYVCSKCLETAKDNFLWVCLNCGGTYSRPKKMIMDRMNGYAVQNMLRPAKDNSSRGFSCASGAIPKGYSNLQKADQMTDKRKFAAHPAKKRSCICHRSTEGKSDLPSGKSAHQS